ncbi:hypothetical protein F2P81_008236 [Scophthalmus maximus]|uniref:Uncharacterized protein n=1 Tax=Scophthalmus maximus TaxID=52904 RepID=A0A6A4TAN0_SCOMX|nr:hypothetical protein F2P81_008236 [Scophthalmus maximus]
MCKVDGNEEFQLQNETPTTLKSDSRVIDNTTRSSSRALKYFIPNVTLCLRYRQNLYYCLGYRNSRGDSLGAENGRQAF